MKYAVRTIIALALTGISAFAAAEDAYPSKPIRLVVPAPTSLPAWSATS